MELLSIWQQKKENLKIVNWLYDLGSELRLGELPQFKKKYNNRFVTRDSLMVDKQDILDIELCHRHFQADYYLKDGVSHVENVKSVRMRCGHRLCPICETIKARQEYTRLTWKMNQIKDDYEFFFLTLTLPNVHTKFDNLIDIMNNCSDDMFKVIQGTDKKHYRCGGFYSTWEVTYSKKKGFHPHLHTIIAIPKGYVKEVKEDRKKSIKSLTINNGFNDYVFSQYSLVELYRKLLEKHAPGVYTDYSYIHLDFRKCYNIENDVRELCKYFIDFTSLPDKDTFILYAQSIYGKKRKKKRGCFKWTEADEEQWKQFIDKLHDEQQRIVQNKNSIKVVFTFDNYNIDTLTYETVLDYLKQGQTFRLKFKDIQNE